MNVEKTLVTVGIVAALVLGVANFGKTNPNIEVKVPAANPTPVQVNVPQQSAPVVNVKAPDTRIPVQPLGAVSTLDGVDNPYVSIGGTRQYFYRQNIAATSSTVCSVKNPFAATSTLLRYTMNVTTNGIAAAQLVDVATSTTALATSSPAFIKALSVGAGKFSVIWLPSATSSDATIGNSAQTGASGVMIGPSEYVNVKIATSTAGTFATYYKGTCSAVFEAL